MLGRIAHVVVVMLVLLAPRPALAQVSVEARLAAGQPPVVIAHRSAVMGGFPENSLAWIGYGLDRGVDMVHINPQLTRDGRYVLMHDPTLNRTTDVEEEFPDGPPGGPTRAQRGGKDYVRDYTLDQIRQLRLVDGAGDGGEAVPTLEEALDLAGGRVLVLLGLKNYEVDSLAAALKGHDPGGLLLFELYFSGTDQTKLRELSDTTGIGVAVALFRSRDYLADLEQIVSQLGPNLRMVNVGSQRVTEAFLGRLDALGIALAISGQSGAEDSALAGGNDPGPWQAALGRGFSASTDQPDLVLRLLDR